MWPLQPAQGLQQPEDFDPLPAAKDAKTFDDVDLPREEDSSAPRDKIPHSTMLGPPSWVSSSMVHQWHQWHQWPFESATGVSNSNTHTYFNICTIITASTIRTQLAKAGVSSEGGVLPGPWIQTISRSHLCALRHRLPLMHASLQHGLTLPVTGTALLRAQSLSTMSTFH